MSKGSESNRRSPSVIARLMGLDGLPHQQPSHKQHTKYVENSAARTTPLGSQRKTIYDGGPHRKILKEKQEFKDVFEVLETSNVESNRYPSQMTTMPKPTEAKMAFIRQKFIDVKRLSTNEKFQNSKEFEDALNVLDSNKDLLLKLLQEPDSLFTKHRHDLHVSSPQSYCSYQSGLTTSTSSMHERHCTGRKSEREASPKMDIHISPPKKHDNSPFSYPIGKPETRTSLKSSKIRIERKDETNVLPTKIVVLKPNLGMLKNAKSPCSSHSSHSDYGKSMELPSIRRDVDLWERKNLNNDVGFTRHNSLESREIAKEITRQMRNSFSSGSLKLSSSRGRGYAGDISDNDSVNRSDSIRLNTRHRRSSSHSTESSVSKEATKRLSERWRDSHRSQEVKVVSGGSTLGEMLALPDRDMRPENMDILAGRGGSSQRFSGNGESSGLRCPLGISSRDGWKDGWRDGSIRSLSRSRSLPSSSSSFGSPRPSIRQRILVDDKYMMRKDAPRRGRNRIVRENFGQHEDLNVRNLRSRKKKFVGSPSTNSESGQSVREIHLCEDRSRNSVEEDLSGQIRSFRTADTGSVVNGGEDDDHESIAMSFMESPEELMQGSCVSFVESCALEIDNLNTQELSTRPAEECSASLLCPIPEPEPPNTPKESDQPSPVSVLEPVFAEDVSSGSECFESLSADLQGLRMQLKLLRLESCDSYPDGSMVVSSDEDIGEEKKQLTRIFRAEESSQSSYLVDVLHESGFDTTSNHREFMTIYPSLDFSASSSVFENLEKKYKSEIEHSVSERKLLFDGINAVLSEIFQKSVNSYPWMKPARLRCGAVWCGDTLEDVVSELLARQVKEAKKEMEGVLDMETETPWLDSEAEIDSIGREVERLVLDELVEEAVVVIM